MANPPHQPPRPLHNSPYNPDPRELHPGPRNRLFLALRSGIDTEVDWALPRLVLASFDQWDRFLLESWVNSVSSLKDWPERWLDQLENKGIRDDKLEARAIMSLQVLRNASLLDRNLKHIARGLSKFIDRFFALPLGDLLDLSLRVPDAFQHILTIVQGVFPYIETNLAVLGDFLIETRDLAMLNLVLPILIATQTIQMPVPDTLVTHLLQLLTLSLPLATLESALDLVISLTLQPQMARFVLSLPSFPAHLKSLVMLLEHDSRPHVTAWNVPPGQAGISVKNPASPAWQAEEASRRRTAEREIAQRRMEATGGMGVMRETGDKPPLLNPAIKAKLYQMAEPMRSITWMHETFVYSSSSQLLQVTFWHAYRDFFQHASTVEQLLSASEVIKNVTVAFPGAHARVWHDERGEQKFVIAGMGFRDGTDENDRFSCLWEGCSITSGFSDTAHLFKHLQTHITPKTISCEWATCAAPFNTSHLLTHLPGLTRPMVPETITVHPSISNPQVLTRSKITSRPVPPLASTYRPSVTAISTPVDKHRHPTGPSFLSALVIRNLARTLKGELAMAAPEQTNQQKEARKKHLMEERFGLPIPATVLKEEEEEEEVLRKQGEGGMGGSDMERAKLAFESVEEGVTRVIESNMSGLGLFLPDAFGW